MHKRFDHHSFEKKWQDKWEEDGIYDTSARDDRKKEYVLVEWPYPSGNLHVGHWYAFAVPDIYVRFQRMNGKQVLYPIGFDAFGLPAENAAIKRNINPREWTEKNIAHMTKQLKSMGAAFSWDRTCASTEPEYYKWTQWMFTKFFESNIAYRGEGIVNWCPGCNTVIANEQVQADGTCERSGDLVEKRKMPQWMLRITDFADALVDDLENLSWPENIKESQKNWIGRSQGAEIDFTLSTGDQLSVFTTRPDTLFGVTYLVLAPEHELVEKLQAEVSNADEIATYRTQAAKKSEIERGDNTKEKTGVLLKDVTATNPANGETIPVYVADYVLSGYGTGAVMAVPAHDERDFAFAQKYDLQIKQVVESENPLPCSDTGKVKASGEFSGLNSEEAKEKITRKVNGRITNTYRLRDWSIGRQRYWGVPIPIVYDPEGNAHPVPVEHLPWTLPNDADFRPTGEAPLAKSEELKERTERLFGKGWTPEVETMDTFVDSSWYFLRYIDNNNSESFSSASAQNDWMQVDTYFGGAEHTTMHLLYSRFWQKALHKIGLAVHDEPYVKRINRGLILDGEGLKMSKSKGNVIDPDEQVNLVGSDTVKMYLAFMGPYQGTNYPWDAGGVAGVHRFLERVYGLDEHISESESDAVTKLLHQTILKVSADIVEYKFNTAISALMVFINLAEKETITQRTYEQFVCLLAPFAPHVTEELWARAGKTATVHQEMFPQADHTLAVDTEKVIGVQVNGKLRADVLLPNDVSEEVAWQAVSSLPQIKERIDDKEILKKIYVPGRIFNIVIKDK